MRNYQKELEKIIEENQKNGIVPSVLLHSCCAPCSSYVLEYLSQFFKITIFYYNPNIYPEQEFFFRQQEQQDLISRMQCKHPVEFLTAQFNPDEFYSSVKGLEHLGEKSERCHACYRLRLEKTASIANEKGFDFFTTTLSISPMKDSHKLCEIGETLDTEGTKYLVSDFKKKNGYKRSVEISREFEMYRQDYCGCVFSLKEKNERLKSQN